MEYVYNFYCSSTAALTEDIRGRFPSFLGIVTSDSKGPSRTIIRIHSGIWDSDRALLDQIVMSHQTKLNNQT
jgi:hypothetical protein